MANSVDPDETPRFAASHLGLHCLLSPVCPNTYGRYANIVFISKKVMPNGQVDILGQSEVYDGLT